VPDKGLPYTDLINQGLSESERKMGSKVQALKDTLAMVSKDLATLMSKSLDDSDKYQSKLFIESQTKTKLTYTSDKINKEKVKESFSQLENNLNSPSTDNRGSNSTEETVNEIVE